MTFASTANHPLRFYAGFAKTLHNELEIGRVFVVAPYAQDLKICSAIEEYSDQFWQTNARDSEELSEKLQVNQDQYEYCVSKTKLQWESERPSDTVLAIAVLVIDLMTIAIGWLIVWACVALGRLVRRGFAAP